MSSTLQQASWGDAEPATILSGDPVDEIRKLKDGDGKDIVLWGSIRLAQALLNAGLIDRIQLNLCPALIGGGKVLFPEPNVWKKLKLVDMRGYDSGVVRAEWEMSK